MGIPFQAPLDTGGFPSDLAASCVSCRHISGNPRDVDPIPAFSKGHHVIPTQKPMSVLYMALKSFVSAIVKTPYEGII